MRIFTSAGNRWSHGIINWDKLYAETGQLLDKYHLEVRPQETVKHLGVGKMQMTEIAKALSENAKGADPGRTNQRAWPKLKLKKLMEILRGLKEHGVTIIYISHRLNEFFQIADSITVLRDGKVITSQPTKNFNMESVVRNMVGREMTERFPKGNRNPGDVIFEVEDLHAVDPDDKSNEIIKGVTFNVRKGEIFGIAGLMGSGRTELVTTIFGEYGKITRGKIKLEGKEIKIPNSHEAMLQGISLVPEDRKRYGLVLNQSILKNISLANLDRFSYFLSH